MGAHETGGGLEQNWKTPAPDLKPPLDTALAGIYEHRWVLVITG